MICLILEIFKIQEIELKSRKILYDSDSYENWGIVYIRYGYPEFEENNSNADLDRFL